MYDKLKTWKERIKRSFHGQDVQMTCIVMQPQF